MKPLLALLLFVLPQITFAQSKTDQSVLDAEQRRFEARSLRSTTEVDGMITINATLPVSLTMIRCIRDYQDRTGIKVGYKPAGGISKAKDSLLYLALMKDELGHPWLQPDLFRFGASSLLGDIERQLEHHLTGHYSAANRHAMG